MQTSKVKNAPTGVIFLKKKADKRKLFGPDSNQIDLSFECYIKFRTTGLETKYYA